MAKLKKTSQPKLAGPVTPRFAANTKHGIEVKSRHTGRVGYANGHADEFLVHDFWSKEGVAKALAHWQGFHVNKNYVAVFNRLLSPCIEQMASASNTDEFVQSINRLLVDGFHRHAMELNKCKQRLVNLMVSLWLFDCVVWQAESWVLPRAQRTLDEQLLGQKYEQLKSICGGLRSRTGNDHVDKHRIRCLLNFVMSYSVFKDIGDICPSERPLEKTKSNKDALSNVLTVLIRLQNDAYSGVEPYTVADFGWVKNKDDNSRSDVEFKWAVQAESRLELWRQAATDYVAGSPRGREHLVYTLNMWLDHVLENPSIASNPVEFFVFKTQAHLPVLKDVFAKNDTLRRMLHNFMQFTMEKHCSVEDDNGRIHVPVSFKNPISKPLKIQVARLRDEPSME